LAAAVVVFTKKVHVLHLAQKYATSYNGVGKTTLIKFPSGVTGVNE
jgi:hypothetical protein